MGLKNMLEDELALQNLDFAKILLLDLEGIGGEILEMLACFPVSNED